MLPGLHRCASVCARSSSAWFRSRDSNSKPAQRYDDAISLYQRGLDADNLVEEFHQGPDALLRAAGSQRRSARGLRATEAASFPLPGRATLDLHAGAVPLVAPILRRRPSQDVGERRPSLVPGSRKMLAISCLLSPIMLSCEQSGLAEHADIRAADLSTGHPQVWGCSGGCSDGTFGDVPDYP